VPAALSFKNVKETYMKKILLLIICVPTLVSAQEVGAGATGITFAEFSPAPSAGAGDTWRLTDSRDGKIYTVRKLADGHFWMTQDLRFGHCTDESFTNGVISRGYAGHCRTNSQPEAGYLYDYPAVVQRAGLCPTGWYVPTEEEYRAADKVFQKEYGCKSYQCWRSESLWAGVPSDFCNSRGVVLYHPGEIVHWTASPHNRDTAYSFVSQPGVPSLSLWLLRDYGMPVRCMKSYDERLVN
jgi:uncharacterized protein (TIGR02145 family)